jgi:hypothetical protein
VPSAWRRQMKSGDEEFFGVIANYLMTFDAGVALSSEGADLGQAAAISHRFPH